MPWSAQDVDIQKINNGSQLTISSTATPEIFNSIVQLQLYLKEV